MSNLGVDADSSVSDERRGSGWMRQLRELIATFPPGTRSRLVAYALLQFVISFLDLAGLAVVVPIMQVLGGAPLDSGLLSTLHGLLGHPGRSQFAVLLCVVMTVAFAAKAVFALLVTRWSLTFVAGLQVRTAANLLRSYLQESYLVLRRRDVGSVIRTLGSAVQAAHASVLGGVLTIFAQLLSIAFILAFLFVMEPVTTLAALAYFGLLIVVVQRVLGTKNRRAGVVAQQAAGDMSHAMHEAIHAAREIALHGVEDEFVDEYERTSRVNGFASRDANFYTQTPKYVLEFATVLGIALLLASAAIGGHPETLMPTITLFIAAAVKLLPTLTALTATLGIVRYGIDGLHMTVEALTRLDARDRGSARMVEPVDVPEARRGGRLVAEGVSFRYPDGSTAVLNDVSFDLPEGRSLAVCGPSGSGKTTLIDIVLGLLDPIEGRIFFGGRDIAEQREAWLRSVAYVPQDVHLLTGTLRQNVAFGLPMQSVDDAQVRTCLELAQLGGLLDGLPEGLDTQIGARGSQLSGGQRQRVGIARALYRKPSVLVLDEATSALDNETEARFGRVLQGLRGQMSVVLVAHRLSTVKHADEVLFVEGGRVAGRGDFASLQARNEAFAHLVRLGSLGD